MCICVCICMKVKGAQSYPTLCNPMDYTVHGIFKARMLEWVAFPFSRGSFQPRIKPRSLALQAGSLPAEPQGKPKNTGVGSLSFLQWIFPTQVKPWSPALQADSLPAELSGMGGRYTREGLHVYLWLIYGEVSQTTTKVYKAIILQSKNKLIK